MSQKKITQHPIESEGEKNVFLRHMAFRFITTLWGLYTVYAHPMGDGLIALFFLALLFAISETILKSQLAWAAHLARKEKKRLAEARQQAAREEFIRAQREAAHKYMELGASAAQKT